MKIIIADDHQIVREGLCSLLAGYSDIKILALAGSGVNAVCLSRELKPDIVIMDAHMPDLDGIEATREIKNGNPDIKVIGLSMHMEKSIVDKMIAAGASGYLHKDCAFKELYSAILTVNRGEIYISPSIAKIIITNYVKNVSVAQPVNSDISGRERQVLTLLAEGHSTKDIAEILCISIKTVQTHRQQVLKKLDLNSTAAIIRYAISNGFISV